MKIARVEAFHVDWGGGRSRSAWVRIWTDAGVYGLGEASPMVHGNASLEIIASAFTPMLLGADPLEPRVIQDRLFHQHIKLGPEGAYAGALAAIDIALWDLKGKMLGQPVWKLLGGAWRRELPFYASIGGSGQRRENLPRGGAVAGAGARAGEDQLRRRQSRATSTRGRYRRARPRKLVGDAFRWPRSSSGYSVRAPSAWVARWRAGLRGSRSRCSTARGEFRRGAAALDIAVSAGEQVHAQGSSAHRGGRDIIRRDAS